jgi:hypothetical protein
MKKIILSITILSTIMYADLTVQQIQKMVLKIHEKRDGIKIEALEDTREPFVHLEIEDNASTYVAPDKEQVKLSLHAILNNRAYINDKWVTLDESVMGYNLKYIGKKGVVLRNENDIKKLFLREKKENYISIEEKE